MANLRNALEAIPVEPISGDAVLLALGFLGQRAEMSAIAVTLGEDASPVAISRVSAAVSQLEAQQLVRRDPVRPRTLELTERGRRHELQVREQLISRSSNRGTLAAAA